MPALDRWFTEEKAREQRAVYLEDALLSGRFAAYARYRLRYFLGRCAVDAILHLLEFVFLAFIFQQHKLVSALSVRVASHFLSAWWWGALESLRGQVRELHRDGKTHLLAKILSGWLSFALLCSGGSLALTVGWVVLDSMRVSRSFDVFHCYVLAVGFRFSLGLFCQTFHSAIYAIRRIYRPFLAIVGVDLFGFLATVLAWPVLGTWSFPLILILTGLLANILTLIYVHAAYRFLGLPPLPLSAIRRLGPRLSRMLTLDFFRAGFAHALTRLDNALVLSLLAGASRSQEGYRLFLLFYLISPFVQAAYTWAQLFYFDLKRLELDLVVYFKQRFTRCIKWVALSMGALFWVVACLFGTLLNQQDLGIIYGFLMLFFLVRSRLAFYQIRAFSEGRYGLLVLTGLAIIGGVWLGRSLLSTGPERFGCLVAILLAAFVWLGVCSVRGLRAVRGGTMLSLPDWLRGLRLLRRPVRLRVASLSRDTDDWLVHQLARKILGKVRATGEMALIGNRRIAWYESAPAATAVHARTILRYGGGLIEAIQSTPYVANGQTAISLAKQTQLLDQVLNYASLEQGCRPSVEELKNRFCARFPKAVLYDAGQPAPVPLAGLSPRNCRELMSGAMQYSKNLFRRVRKAHFDVTTLCEAGRIRLIFGIPQSEPRSAREAWKSFINEVNVSNAINPNTQPPEEIVMSPNQVKRTGLWIIGLATPALLLGSIQMDERVTGSFLLKTTDPIKVYAPVAGFVKSLAFKPEERLAAGSTIAWLEVPDLASRLARKRAELKEAEAIQRLLLNGRPGAESALTEPEPDLADTPASLNLMEVGTRPQVVEIKRADVERLGAEAAYLEQLEKGQAIRCPLDGMIATPEIGAKIGSFVRAGDLICELVAADRLTIEISLPEQEAARVQVGQRVELKVRSLPYETLKANVDHIAPQLEQGDGGRRLRVFCGLQHPPSALRPGMSGFAHVYVGQRAAGLAFLDRLIRFVRVEFWW